MFFFTEKTPKYKITTLSNKFNSNKEKLLIINLKAYNYYVMETNRKR